ncbi:hypothetical protein [Stenotrophomonas sp. PS02297]|uniref:hypothetical protein n=1 Tax=Stenotrophomonas sp. PS02297 TaxID=2991423 RepID=UPI00249C47A4|nr:hypothetical protein [Stenotrophomonas sp. PS02297]
MRNQALTTVKAGITRLRDKGGASPDSLYDLLNGYVTAARTIKSRPGTRIDLVLPPETKGLVWFQGKFVVFSHSVTSSSDDRVEVEVLRNPESPGTPIKDIHFALPFLGYLYVVAEFDDGFIWHYWLEKGEVWQSGKWYLPGTLVRPSNGNGMAYRVQSDRAGYVPWAPNVGRVVDDVVVPIEDNGFRYVVTETTGDSPRSGTLEPAWPTNPGETVIEDVTNRNPSSTGQDAGTPTTDVPPSVKDRYGSGGKSGSTTSEVQ